MDNFFHYFILSFLFANTSVASVGMDGQGLNESLQQFKNGLTVIHRQPPNPQRVGIALIVELGLKDFSCQQQAAPHLLEHLFFEGTSMFSANQLRQRIREKDGKANGLTTIEETIYTIDIQKDFTEFAIQHLFHMLIDSRFDDSAYYRAISAIEAERGISRQVLKKTVDHKRSVLEQTISRAYQGSTIECYKKAVPSIISLDTLIFLKQKYYQPQNMTLIVLGDVAPHTLQKILRKTFSSLSSSKIPIPDGPRVLSKADIATPVVEFSSPTNIEADLFMIIPAVGYSHKDAYVVEIITDYLDEQLFKIIRNDLGVGYSPNAIYFSGVDVGYIRGHVKTTSRWIDQAEQAFLSVYDDLLKNGIPKERLKKLVATRKLQIESEEKTTFEWLHIYRKKRRGLSAHTVNGLLNSISQESVKEVMRNYFPKQPTIGVLKPRTAKNTTLYISFILIGSAFVGAILVYINRRFILKLRNY